MIRECDDEATGRRQVPQRGALNLDHVAHFVPDIEAAREALERLGFAPTPFSAQQHRPRPGADLEPAGAGNRCVMLRRGYIEFLVAAGETQTAQRLRAAMARYVGVHLVCFGTAAPDDEWRRLVRQGFAPLSPVALERAVTTVAGEALARFTVIRVPPEVMQEGRIQFVRHHTPELVWQSRWLDHPNRATGLAACLICVADAQEAAARYARFSGLAARPAGGAMRVGTARGALILAEPAAIAELLEIAPPTPPSIAGYVLESDDLAASRALLVDAGLAPRRLDSGALALAMPPALGAIVVFAAQGSGATAIF